MRDIFGPGLRARIRADRLRLPRVPRPTLRPRAARLARAVRIPVAVALLVFVGVAALSVAYASFGFRPVAGARAWAELKPAFAQASSCASCHPVEYARETTAKHQGIGCESCHGPLLAHVGARPGTPEADIGVAVPTDAVCIRCHAAATGRPGDLRQITVGQHYISACLVCHDPHTSVAARPPVVLHPLTSLPPCVTCHGPDGFKARNQRHPVVSTDDSVCLSCHAKGRGPDDGGGL